jgi:outer membrane protein assembly factor BamA
LPAGGNYARGAARLYLQQHPRLSVFDLPGARLLHGDRHSRPVKGLGSDYEQLVISGELRHYLTILPLPPKHVLASRLAMRLSAGNDLADIFRMGGVVGQSILTTSTQDFFPLRGLLTAGLSGTALLNGSVEYRAPIYRLERGLGSWPIALRVLHAAVFADFGRVFDTLKPDFSGGFGPALSDFFSGFALGAGAELRADVLLGFVVDLELRLGYGHLLYAPFSGLDGSGFYFQIGSTY